MALNRAIITPAESQVILAAESDWIALTDSVQEQHIEKGSVYVQTQWTCVDVDWDDDTTISQEIKDAVAYYSLADFRGTLYDSTAPSETDLGKISEESSAVGSLKKTIKYCCDEAPSTNPLQYPDSLMRIECTSYTSASLKTVNT